MNEKYQHGDKILILFSATWCIPCHKLKYLISANEMVNRKIKDKFVDYFVIEMSQDVEQVEEFWIQKSDIRVVPTLVVYKYNKNNWEERDRIQGLMNADRLIQWLEQSN